MSRLRAALLAALAVATQSAAAQAAAPPPGRTADALLPPWRGDRDDTAPRRGLEFTVPQADVLADFHGDLTDPRLVLFVGGNYFFAVGPLVEAFGAAHPEFRGRVYWETIPPGLLVGQMRAGGRVTVGNMTWRAQADVYLAGLEKVRELVEEGLLAGPAEPYVSNTLTIMTPAGNPAHVRSLADLARPGLRLAMPDPAFEGVARQIKAALERAGGPALADAVYGRKVRDGSTELTRIHHRQTPLFLMQGRADAGVTWASEAIYQESIGNPIGHVDIPEAQNETGVYAAAAAKAAPHAEAARLWLDFIRSPAALAIFARYGFRPYAATAAGSGR